MAVRVIGVADYLDYFWTIRAIPSGCLILLNKQAGVIARGIRARSAPSAIFSGLRPAFAPVVTLR
jgi:hypothetical protein